LYRPRHYLGPVFGLALARLPVPQNFIHLVQQRLLRIDLRLINDEGQIHVGLYYFRIVLWFLEQAISAGAVDQELEIKFELLLLFCLLQHAIYLVIDSLQHIDCLP